ncbi:hypothetical protein H2O64_19155 [Kordia sp. YSTF-M3]|uniref:TonB-dependent receptor plug domain-containing protein n=1 Tax=Kordia aestuariivivens TaxID=2759037 RepID=A0ABR7QE30_9FLAO|nr:hypothetical protein [Kordia aestuariivivens]MBC8756800.1 hypothetical protein [Kordia aestuariivivens]
MKKHYHLFCVFSLISLHVFAQTASSISERYQAHFKYSEEEAVFVHLNKTTYLVGEEIWFKGYIFNKRNEEISAISTNLHVGLYDENGKQVTKELFRIRNGCTNGNLKLDTSVRSGTYYIKAATQQMVDEQSAEVFIEEITIYGKDIPVQKIADSTTKKYDIQFLPEGGHLVKGVENTIAFKAINQEGKGVYVNGIIYDASGNEVITYESNNLGFGVFKLLPENRIQYKATTTFEEDKTSEQVLPKVAPTGIAIQVDNLAKDTLKISLSTNPETLRSIVSKEYTLLIHKDGWARSMPFSFKNTETVDLSIARNRLFNGVNTITLFDGKTPVLERMFFNRKVVKELSVMVKKTETEGDFSKFSLYLIKNKPRIREANVSISILPATSEGYDPAHTIFSSFYLKPYIRGEIENPKYYFPNKTKTRRKALDALLITQGWSKYDWTAIFQEQPKQPIASQGITIKGTVNFPLKGIKGMFLHDTKDQKAQYIPIDDERKFVVYNLYPEADEKLRFSYISNKKEFSQPKLYLRYNVSSKKDALPENATIDRVFNGKNNIFSLPDDFFPSEAEALDKVVLNAKNKNKKEKKDPTMVNGVETKITEVEYLRYQRVSEFIQYNGSFDVVEGLSLGRLEITSRRMLTLGGLPSTREEPSVAGASTTVSMTKGSGNVSPLVFIDGNPLKNFNVLANLSMARVERIIIDKTGLGYGMRGTGGVIKIFTRKTPLTQTSTARRDSYVYSVPPIGFSVAKQYYTPKYQSFSNDAFLKYGAVDWLPNIYIPRRGSSDFIVKHKDLKGITMFIEGVSKDGSLISQKRTITLIEDEE